IVLWGSNARETHPIFFHHVLQGVHHGARLYVVDPRRTSSADWAVGHLPLHVGTDIALANAVAREILAAGLENHSFIDHATSGFAEFRASVEPWTLTHAEAVTGVPAAAIRELAHAFARADRAVICWTLGITEHHNAVDNVLALINLGLLTGHVGRYGSGLSPLRGQNNVQGGGDMGALPDRLPGFQHVENDALRAKFEHAWGASIPPKSGWHLSGMFEAMERGDLTALYVIGENPATSEADQHHTMRLLRGLRTLVVQDVLLTQTAELADVVLPAAAGWCESEGTVTSSERRVQRVRRALPPPPGVRDDLDILCDLARRMGKDLGNPSAEALWDEVRSLSPAHAGMSYARLEASDGLQWPCYDESHPGELYLHGRLWERPVVGPLAPFSCVTQEGPVEELSPEFPLRLTTGRRLDSYNTGVQTGLFASPMRRRETLDLSPEDARRLEVADGDTVRVASRRGTVLAPARIDPGLPQGLVFLTLHFPDQVATNELTVEAVDPKSGTSEFKAAAVRVELVEKQGAGRRQHGEAVSGATPASRPAVLEPVSS
ncbi:MAG TPA: molybdopterin-dependent oxidoreductase, partial [Thermoanaerobaculia bacterium]|nr:molybdopterin-dependent oxidoreductase [Thermoanaerobaculia bacterium]